MLPFACPWNLSSTTLLLDLPRGQNASVLLCPSCVSAVLLACFSCLSLFYHEHLTSLLSPLLSLPPGRLRHYDLFIFDEISQVTSDMWFYMSMALAELPHTAFCVFLGDFQQLQPIQGLSLQRSLTADVHNNVFHT